MPEIRDDIVQVKKEKKESVKIKVSEESIEIKCPKEDENKESMKIKDENTTGWYDKNEFEKILRIVNSNKFSHKNKIGKLRYKDLISNLINNINNNTISEILPREKLNKSNEIKKADIKGMRIINGQKELLTFFNMLLNAIFTEDNNDSSNNHSDDNDSVTEDDTDDGSMNEEVNEENEEEHHNEKDENDDENDHDENDENRRMISEINNNFKMIDESESFENQINLLRKMDYLDDWWHQPYNDDDKELNLTILKLKFAYISNIIDKMLFENIFSHTFVTLANKVINATNEEENQIIIKDIKKIWIFFTKQIILIIV